MTTIVPVISLRDVNYSINNSSIDNEMSTLHILKHINLTIEQGVSMAITGRSGSGKTTLLNVMAGLDIPTSGDVYYQDIAINSLDEDARAKFRAQKVGFIFQDFHLLPNLTAWENVMLPLEINQNPNAKDIARDWLAKVGLASRVHHYPNQLSGGEQQRVAVARAFSIEPEILFADEPTGNLDKANANGVTQLLFDLNEQHGSSLIIVTHDQALAKHCSIHRQLDDGELQ